MKEKILKVTTDEVVKLVTDDMVEWCNYFVYLNGRPVDALSASADEGWVEVIVKDRHGKPIQKLGDDLTVVTTRAYGLVQIIYRDSPPEDWNEDVTLGDLHSHINPEELEILITNQKKVKKDGKT